MAYCLKIMVADPDPDYLGIEILASNDRFSGATFIYAGLEELSRFAKAIAGFPRGREDERECSFGTKGQNFAGGFCSFRFYCRDSSGHGAVHVELEDDGRRYAEASVRFDLFPVLAGDIDRFVSELRSIEKGQSGQAKIESHG